MSETIAYRHPVTNRIKHSSNALYMERAGFEVWDGEIEKDKTGIETAHLTKAELQDLLGAEGLPTSGNKQELQQRLADAAANDTTTPSKTPDAASDGAADSSSNPAGEDSDSPEGGVTK